MANVEYKIQSSSLNLHYGKFHALRDVSISIKPRMITAIIGPSGCGKSTLLRCFNRMNDLIPGVRVSGGIMLDGRDIHGGGLDLTSLRKRVGMVFQRPNPFPLTIFDNVVYGMRVHGMRRATIQEPAAGEAGPQQRKSRKGQGILGRLLGRRGELDGVVESSLRATMLWDALKDKLHTPALDLSAEQQQRLCISRLVAVEPEVLLMDEPCSALDPIATEHIEELMRQLSARYTIVIVTHNMQQAARISQETGFMLLGDLVEFGLTSAIFTRPADKRTEDYVTGRYG